MLHALRVAFPLPRWGGLVLAAGIGIVVAGAGMAASGLANRLPGALSLRSATAETKVPVLQIPTRTVELPRETAGRARQAIQNGDFAAARGLVTRVLADSRVEAWRFHPFTDFIAALTPADDTAFAARLDQWVTQNGNDALPLLLRAQYLTETGWARRGHEYAPKTPAASMAAFVDCMKKALADVEAAISIDPQNPYAFYLRLRILQGFGMSQQVVDAFNTAIAKHPAYYPLYEIVLFTLHPKWGGSIEAMYDFVEHFATQAPEHSPLKLLYLDLYRSLLGTATASCSSEGGDKDKAARCVDAAMHKMVTPELERRVVAALDIYDHVDRYQFAVAVDEILRFMSGLTAGQRHADAVLQLAADAMHSDTQLKQDHPGPNSYVIDRLVSMSWWRKGFYENALTKAEEALKDAQATTFPNETEKDLALAGIYEQLARVYGKLNRYAEVIAYEQASVALGGPSPVAHFICHGYFKLRDYASAVEACNKTIAADPDNLNARYWRSAAYQELGQPDRALPDLVAVAESQNEFRGYAVIEMSMIYFNRKDDRAALDVLNRYSYLYQEDAVSRSNIAIGYNNRCYAYMQLGDLHKALDDCTASLRYGSLPDALRKQRELVRRLNVGETRL